MVSNECDEHIPGMYDATQLSQIDFVFAILTQSGGTMFTLSQVVSLMIMLYSVLTIIMLQRTQDLGNLITMFLTMINELKKFLVTFGLVIIAIVIVGRQLNG